MKVLPSPTIKSEALSPEVKGFLQDIQNAKNERDWLTVIALQKQLKAKVPNDESIDLEVIDSYLTIENYAEAQPAAEKLVHDHPQCGPCHVALWNVMREKENRSEGVLATIRENLKHFEKTILNPHRQMDWFSLYQGSQMTGDSVLEARCREKIFHLVKLQGFSDPQIKNFMADQLYVDLLRGQPTVSPAKFVDLFPEFSQIDLIYNLEINRRVSRAQTSFFKFPVTQWSKKWIRERPESRKAYFASAGAFRTLGIKKKLALDYLDHTLWLIDHRGQVYREPLYSDAAWQQRLQESRNMVLHQRAWYWHLQGQSERAFQAFADLDQANLKDGEFQFHFGRVALALGRNEIAEQHFLRAVDVGADPNSVLQNLRTVRKNKTLTLEDIRRELWREQKAISFEDVSAEIGLKEFPAQFVSFADFDGDGDEDILLSGGPVPGLFENKSNDAGEVLFENIWGNIGPKNIVRFGSGVWADVNQDGQLDLFLTMVLDDQGQTANHILINRLKEGKGFVDQTNEMVETLPVVVTAAAAFGDVNADGYPDIYVANYEKNGDPLARGTRDFLLINRGGKTFEEKSTTLGCVSAEPMCGRGVNWADYDNDGDQDIYVSNYRLDPNFLFKNTNGRFAEIAKTAGVRGTGVLGNFGHSIGSEWGDLNNDGWLDLVVANLAHPRGLAYSNKTQVLLQSPRDHTFHDTFKNSGVNYLETHSDPSLGDLDNDGDLDLILTAIYAGAPVTVYSNRGDGTFDDVTFRSGIRSTNTWGGALGDIDGDGDLDFVVASLSGAHVFENKSAPGGFLEVCPRDRKTKSVVLGARVTVLQSGKKQIREVEGGKGTGNQHSLCVEFGFGSNPKPVDVEIRFPNGLWVKKSAVKINQLLNVER